MVSLPGSPEQLVCDLLQKARQVLDLLKAVVKLCLHALLVRLELVDMELQLLLQLGLLKVKLLYDVVRLLYAPLQRTVFALVFLELAFELISMLCLLAALGLQDGFELRHFHAELVVGFLHSPHL